MCPGAATHPLTSGQINNHRATAVLSPGSPGSSQCLRIDRISACGFLQNRNSTQRDSPLSRPAVDRACPDRSQFTLDFPIHPKRLALAPVTGAYLGWDLLAWGSRPGWLGAINGWWLQLAVLLVLLVVYATGAHGTRSHAAAVAASSALLIGVQLLTSFRASASEPATRLGQLVLRKTP